MQNISTHVLPAPLGLKRKNQMVKRSDGKIFNSIKLAAAHHGRTHCGNISSVIRGKEKKAYGFGWEYYFEDHFGEEWKQHPTIIEIQCSNAGRIQTTNGYKTNGSKNNKGYLSFHSGIGNPRKNYLVHRLIAETWIDNPDNKLTVNHIDLDKTNNFIWNLEWCTQQEQIDHYLRYQALNN